MTDEHTISSPSQQCWHVQSVGRQECFEASRYNDMSHGHCFQCGIVGSKEGIHSLIHVTQHQSYRIRDIARYFRQALLGGHIHDGFHPSQIPLHDLWCKRLAAGVCCYTSSCPTNVRWHDCHNGFVANNNSLQRKGDGGTEKSCANWFLSVLCLPSIMMAPLPKQALCMITRGKRMHNGGLTVIHLDHWCSRFLLNSRQGNRQGMISCSMVDFCGTILKSASWWFKHTWWIGGVPIIIMFVEVGSHL